MSEFVGFSTWSGKRYVIGEFFDGHVITQIVRLIDNRLEVWSGCELIETVPTHRISFTHYAALTPPAA